MAEVPKQLIPFKPKGDRRSDELRAKLKGSGSDKRRKAMLVTASKVARCKNCKLDCDFKDRNLRSDPDALCVVPTLRADAIFNETAVREWDDDKIMIFINELLGMYKNLLIEDAKLEVDAKKMKRETVRDFNTMMNRLVLFKEKYYPTVEKKINVNIDIKMEEMLKKWREERMKLIVVNDSKIDDKEKEEGEDGV